MGLCEAIRDFVCGTPAKKEAVFLTPIEPSEFQKVRQMVASVDRHDIETRLRAMTRRELENLNKTEREFLRSKWVQIRINDAKVEMCEQQAKLDSEDGQHLKDIREGWTPDIIDQTYQVGRFIGYGVDEFPVRFIENITITEAGGPPTVNHYWNGNGFNPSDEIIMIGGHDWGVITITMASGAKNPIKVNRHKLPFVYEALKDAWKGAKV